MPKHSYFLRYLLIIRKLSNGKHATYNELNSFLQQEGKMYDEDLSISARTLQRDIVEINRLFNISIQFDFSKKVYCIENENDFLGTTKMLEIFDFINVSSLSHDYQSLLHFEPNVSKSTELIYPLLKAAKQNKVVEIYYQKAEDTEPTKRLLQPYFLKQFKQRWYLIAIDESKNAVRTFALDRVSSLRIFNKKFTRNLGISNESVFKDVFGIIAASDMPVEKIILNVDSEQAFYVKNNPLHHSQKIIREHENGMDIELFIKPTYDFIVELLSQGDSIIVKQPIHLKNKVKTILVKASKRYA